MRKVVLVGSPNVGKSVIFNCLTGKYVSVSNYPGTTVEIARGYGRLSGEPCEVIDTPGLYSLLAITEEEQVTREFLLEQGGDVIVHVADAKNIRRMLNLTLELLDAGLPVALDLNLMDEAAAVGMTVNTEKLSAALGVPVVTTAAVKNIGIAGLKRMLTGRMARPEKVHALGPEVEQVIAAITGSLTGTYPFSRRFVALMLLQEDKEFLALCSREPGFLNILAVINKAAAAWQEPPAIVVAMERQKLVDRLLAAAVRFSKPARGIWRDRLDRLLCWPPTGVPILLLVLYCGLYQFVGGFGAGYLVNAIDERLFQAILTPALDGFCNGWLPWEWARSLLAGEYGLFTMGLRYAVAIIFPIVGTFFLAFAVLEDCGYLPRLAMLSDRLFRWLGLNGRAVIPMTLGLGCGTMAVFVTRTLETRRERFIATFLLALAIPCSAQLGVVLALLAHNGQALCVWLLYIAGVFVLAGYLTARLTPGRRSQFYMELPPLRVPSVRNVFKKAYTRMIWYAGEIVPVFFLASFLLWLGDRTGALQHIIHSVEPVMDWLGLPPQTAQTFLLGFFRRDYGAAGLYDMAGGGLLSDWQLVTAAVVLTLFVPCLAQFLVMVKERGPAAACAMAAATAVTALGSGWLLHQLSAWLPL